MWLTVTFATAARTAGHAARVLSPDPPSAAGWGPIAKLAPEIQPARDGLANLIDWAAGCMLIYGALFGTGKLLLKEFLPGLALLAMGAVGLVDPVSRSVQNEVGMRLWISLALCAAVLCAPVRWSSAWPS